MEAVVEGLGKQGFMMRRAIDIEIAIARADLDAIGPILESWSPQGLDDVEGLVARLVGLVALGRRDEIETEAPVLVIGGSYLEPSALRALGRAPRDPSLIEKAVERFVAMSMEWHAGQTRGWLGPGA